MADTQTGTIWTLYVNTELTRDKNRQLDDMEHFLADFLYLRHSNSQYFKHALHKTLKINRNQNSLELFNDGNNFDYASIKNPNDNYPVYYFVTGRKWLSENTIEYELLMDTINTLKSNYTLSDKTTIIRQHEDRFILQDDYMRRKVNNVPEDLQPVLFKKGETNVWKEEDEEGYYQTRETDKFYLFYVNQYEAQDETPLQGFGCFDTSKRVIVDWRKTFSFLVAGDVYVIAPDLMRTLGDELVTTRNGARLKIEFIDTTGHKKIVPIYYEGIGGLCHTAAIYAANNQVWIVEMTFDDSGNIRKGTPTAIQNNDTHLTFISKTERYTSVFPYRQVTYSTYSNATNYFTDFTGTIQNIALDTMYATISPIGAVDRTNVRLQKIIELPYPPQSFSVDELTGYMTLIDTDFGVDSFGISTYLELQDLSARFSCDLFHEDPLKNIKEGFNNEPKATDTAEMRNESKLYNSDYFITKFVYDSMSYIFKLEQADGYSEEKTTFHPTSTMNSKFAFMFDWDKINTKEDYDNVLLASRNNELPIYNNSYMNYIRNGYNYDVKTRENAAQVSYITSALQIAAGAASAALAPTTGGLSGALGVSLVSQGVNALINTEVTRANAALAQAQKMEQLKDQGTNVSGSDDIDLLNAYSGNKAKLVGYSVSDEVKNALYTLFRFYGYKSNKRGVPNTTSRYWYNFIQCDAVIASEYNISEELENDIIARYKEGVTVMHYHTGYDWNQTKENWEVDLVGHLDPGEEPLEELFEDVGTVGSGSGEWTLTPPIYGLFGTTMASGQYFKYIVCLGSIIDPTYHFTAEDGLGNTYQFIPQSGGYKVIMTRLMDGRTFEKTFTVNRLYRLTSVLHTINVPWVTSIASNYQYSLDATKNL